MMICPVLIVVFVCNVAAHLPRDWSNFSVPNVAFVHLLDGDLYASQFGVWTMGSISICANIGNNLKHNEPIVPRVVVHNLMWPNELTSFPNNGSGFVFGDGFLVPGKETGSLSSVSTAPTIIVRKLTTNKTGFFYHRGRFVDVNCDGAVDIVTARAHTDWTGGGMGELIWLESPYMTEHKLLDGPDINFDLLHLNGSSAPFVVFAAEFFGEQLTAIEVGCGGVVKGTNVIDNTIGKVYTVVVADLYNSGTPARELVVTNYEYASPGSLFVYELSAPNPLVATRRHVVYDQFKNVQWLPGSGAAGFVYPHFATVAPAKGQRASILVAGDGAQRAFLFSPIVNSSSAYAFELSMNRDYGGTVGGMTVGDVDNDGFNEIFLTVYEAGMVQVLTYCC